VVTLTQKCSQGELTVTFFKLQPLKKKLILLFIIINLLVIGIIFAKETMGPSLTSAALGSSQEVASRVNKNLKMVIKILLVE
jgi:hypothetical protein